MPSFHDSVWIFTDSKDPNKKIEVNGLSSAQNFALMLRYDELSQWNVYEKGTSSVQVVLDCAILFAQNKASSSLAAAFSEKRELSLEKSNGKSDQRSQQRLAAKFRVIVHKGKDLFTTYSKNVSSGGMLLEDPLPEQFHGSDCRILIDRHDVLLSMEFHAKILSTSSSGTRIKFDGEAAEASLKKLLLWIQSQEPHKKTAKLFRVA